MEAWNGAFPNAPFSLEERLPKVLFTEKISEIAYILMGLGVIGKNSNEQGKLKLHATFVAIFLVVAHVAMIFGMLNPELLA